MNEQQKYFWEGVRAEVPLLIGVFPFGMIYGALAIDAGLSDVAAQMMSSTVFAGSAQFITAQLVKDSTPGFVIVLTIAVVNLRHMLYSASLAPYLASVSTRWKMLLSYLLTDEAYAPSIIQYENEGVKPFSHWFLFGAGAALWIIWQVSTALGIFLGAAIPDSWSLDFALPLTFIAMVVPVLKNRPSVAAALSAGCVALAAGSLPYKLGLIVAALVGIAIGIFLEKRMNATPDEKPSIHALRESLDE
ncbi:MAG TPA: AzlC family ABC transporter permease [Anaerolineales bacterium]|nr:AzlC family ABC transporter permease [Anaerolineales bacterium]HNQ96187.1 AzlC family ABC transporter permease [Anaerolineales bacterium]HNS62012.1 AzlC family ABC transporter permease [Anaerolineales bacterium]